MKLSVLKNYEEAKNTLRNHSRRCINTSEQENIPFTEKDLHFIEDKIGDFLGSRWHDAIMYALKELERVNMIFPRKSGHLEELVVT